MAYLRGLWALYYYLSVKLGIYSIQGSRQKGKRSFTKCVEDVITRGNIAYKKAFEKRQNARVFVQELWKKATESRRDKA